MTSVWNGLLKEDCYGYGYGQIQILTLSLIIIENTLKLLFNNIKAFNLKGVSYESSRKYSQLSY